MSRLPRFIPIALVLLALVQASGAAVALEMRSCASECPGDCDEGCPPACDCACCTLPPVVVTPVLPLGVPDPPRARLVPADERVGPSPDSRDILHVPRG